MKKYLALLLTVALCLSMFAACGGSAAEAPASAPAAEGSAAAEAPAAEAPAADAQPAVEVVEQEALPAEEEIAVPTEPVTVTIGSTYPRFVGVFDMMQIANDQLALPAGYLAFDTLIRMDVLDSANSLSFGLLMAILGLCVFLIYLVRN